jgi:uncharacterized RDD family membrane protein YckC
MSDTIITNLPLARKRMRFLASLIDYLIYCIFYWVIASAYGSISTSNGSFHSEVNGLPAVFCFAFWFIIPVSEGLFGQSFGKFACDLKVMDITHSQATMSQCIIRHLFDLVDFFPFLGITGLLVASNNTSNQRVGDLVARTIVVKK